ncbi:O-antigen ligase family protein [Sphingomonas sp. LR55]|uniref:O-antigen ligase family protein n=1 Tax=Sphingomonas sp. LR55 TaxID=3050231 RepID=UPI002FE2C0F8
MIAVPQRRTLPFVSIVLPMLVARPSLDPLFGLGRMNLGAFSITPGFLFNFLFVALASLVMLHALLVDRRAQTVIRTAAIIWAPFLLAALIAAVHSPVFAEAIQVLFNYLTFAAVSMLALYYAPYIGRRVLTLAVALSGVVPLATGLIQIALGDMGERLEASFTHPNILAFFMMIYISFLYHAQLSNYLRSGWQRNAVWILLVVAALELLLTGTRSAYVATALFLIVYTAFQRPLYLIPILLAGPLAMLVPGVMDRITNAAEGAPEMSYAYLVSISHGDVDASQFVEVDSGTWRRYLWQAAWPWIERKMTFGYGLSSFAPLSRDFFALTSTNGSGAHNVYVQTIFEGGLVLMLSFVYLLVSIVAVSLFRATTSSEKLYIFLAIVGYAVVSVSDNMLYYLSVNVEFVFILGCIIGQAPSLPSWLTASRRQPQLMIGGLR